jgi:hypothetical protein
MLPDTGVHRLASFDADALEQEFRNLGYHVYRLRGDVVTRGDFFRAVRAVLPLDPPLARDDNWDALADSLFGGLDGLEQASIAVLWPGAAGLVAAHPDEFRIAVEVLGDVCAALSNESEAVTMKRLVVLYR